MALTARRAFLVLWLALLLPKLWLASRLPLLGDEAWYWLEGQRLAWAYSDLPGLTAWLARLGAAIAGDHPFGLRWPFLALGAAVPWLGVRVATRWFGEEAGWRAGLVCLLLPLASVLGVLAVPDVPLVVATLLAFDAGVALLGRVASRHCVQLAIALAMGATCHYRFAIALAGLAAGCLATPDGRALLRDHRVLAALAAGALAWLPVLLFNLHHREAGLRFQFVDRHPWRFHVHGLELQAVQPLLAGPLLFAGLVWVLWQAWKRRRDPRWCLLLGAAALPLLVFVGLGPFADIQRVSFHWPLSSWVLACTALPNLLGESGSVGWRRAILASNAVLCAGLWWFAMQLVLPGGDARLERLGFRPKMFPTTDDVAATTRERLASMPADAALVADNFMLAARLGFALGDGGRVYSLDHRLDAKHGRALQLAIWGRDESALPALESHPILLVVEETALHPEAREPWNRHLCSILPGLRAAGEVDNDADRQRFLFYRRDPAAAGPCDYPSLAFVRIPEPDAAVSGVIDVAGWATQDGVGVAKVEVMLDGRSAAVARYGIEDVGVRSQWPESDDPGQPDVGFEASVNLRNAAPGGHALSLRVTGRDGRSRVLELRTIRVGGH